MKALFLFFLFPYLAFACPENYVGRYLGLNDDQFLSKFDSVEIQFEDSLLKLTYNYEGANRFTESYRVDGEEHEGDGGRTGHKYSVFCESGNLVIRREFNQIVQPLIYDFHFGAGELQLVESFEGTEYKRLAARFKKID